MERAREQLRRPPPRVPVPTWVWIIGGVVVVVLLVLVGPRLDEWFAPPLPSPGTVCDSNGCNGDTQIRPTDEMVMVYVPGGIFQMGSERRLFHDADSHEFPQHPVTLDPFWIDQTEVTNAQFAAFLNDRGNQTEGGVTWLELESDYSLIEQAGDEYQPKSGYADHPVIAVSWYGEDAYCQWTGAQLPTEAQWEYAARGEQGYIYPWGNNVPTCKLAQFDECSRRTISVGSLPGGASWCGALDMAGNTWEWTADWYGAYLPGAQTNPTGPAEGEYKVVRGGSFDQARRFVRASGRYIGSPGSRDDDLGFRCVVQAPGQ